MKENGPDIITAITSGDHKQYELMYRYYYKKLYNYGRKLTDDVVIIEDAIQETFLKLWADQYLLEKIASPRSYLFRLFRNKIISYFKDQQKETHLAHADIFNEVEFAVDHFIIQRDHDQAVNKQLQDALAKLTDRQREIIFLRFYENLSYEEAAVILNISIKGSYKLMARAILDLKLHLNMPTGVILMLIKLLYLA